MLTAGNNTLMTYLITIALILIRIYQKEKQYAPNDLKSENSHNIFKKHFVSKKGKWIENCLLKLLSLLLPKSPNIQWWWKPADIGI